VIDYRGLRESRAPHVNYFVNSVAATRAHRRFLHRLVARVPGILGEHVGITASDSIKGYVAWGGPPGDPSIDGTVVPSAPAGSLMFTPDISLAALKEMRRRYGERVYGRYGFVDAFNPNNDWVDPDVIGISVGITLLSVENLRSQGVWRWFYAERGSAACHQGPSGWREVYRCHEATRSLLTSLGAESGVTLGVQSTSYLRPNRPSGNGRQS